MAPVSKSRKKKQIKVSPKVSEWIKAFLIALVLLILLRFFVFDFFSFTDSSMEKTILPGDILIINKYNYGARMPMRILPQSWVKLFYTTDSLAPTRQFPYWRFPGSENPDYNQMILMNIPAPHVLPIDQRTRTVKRMVALPGDIFEIKKTDIIINGEKVENPPTAQWNYTVDIRRNTEIESFLKKYHIKEGTRTRGNNRFVFPFTPIMADSISRLDEVRRVDKLIPSKDNDFKNPFGIRAQQWTPDNFGPLVIPYKGYTIELTAENTDIYFYHLVYHEGLDITLRNDSAFIDEEFAKTYAFRNDYYFLMGDNRHNTTDSRLWGMVPENHIIGQAKSIFLSFDKDAGFFNKIRWRRILKSLTTEHI
jgi:signal peptidase I